MVILEGRARGRISQESAPARRRRACLARVKTLSGGGGGPSGSKDRTKVGLYFARKPARKRLRSATVPNLRFQIPAGAAIHEVTAFWTASEAIRRHSISPHMHLWGREIQVEAKFPDGVSKTLVKIGDWDFNWQQYYWFRNPVALPKGTRLELRATFDNNAENPNNPSRPPRVVRFGRESTDEMAVAYFNYIKENEDLTQK